MIAIAIAKHLKYNLSKHQNNFCVLGVDVSFKAKYFRHIIIL